MSQLPLITRHRPESFDTLRGNEEVFASLQRRISEPGRPHSYLFTGPSGVGKTTVARIIGTAIGAEVIEIDAASNNGIDAIREMVDLGYYLSPTNSSRMIIIDECHMLSRAAWNAALKTIEEPPDHLYLVLCTTELHKVPETVQTRCYHGKLDRLTDAQIADVLLEVMEAEGWMEAVHNDVFGIIVHEANGSPRRALTLLQSCYDAPSPAEARRIIAIQGDSDPMIKCLGILLSGKAKWEHVLPLLNQMKDDDFSETSLIGACRYVIGAMCREQDEKRASRMWGLLACFVYPAHTYDPKSSFFAAVGRILWSEA